MKVGVLAGDLSCVWHGCPEFHDFVLPLLWCHCGFDPPEVMFHLPFVGWSVPPQRFYNRLIVILPFFFCNGICSFYLVEDFEFLLPVTPVFDYGYFRVVTEIFAPEVRACPFWWRDDAPRFHHIWFQLAHWREGADGDVNVGCRAVFSVFVCLFNWPLTGLGGINDPPFWIVIVQPCFFG